MIYTREKESDWVKVGSKRNWNLLPGFSPVQLWR
jgi:hypothetical protein